MSTYQSFFFRSEKSYWNWCSNVSQRNLCCKCQCSNGVKDVSINLPCLQKMCVRSALENSEIGMFFSLMKLKKKKSGGKGRDIYILWIARQFLKCLAEDLPEVHWQQSMNLLLQRLFKSCHFYIIQNAYKRKTQSCICWSQEEFRIKNCFQDVSLQGINTSFPCKVFSFPPKGKKVTKALVFTRAAREQAFFCSCFRC